MSEPNRPKPRTGLVSIDDAIDKIAGKALFEARRREETERLKQKSKASSTVLSPKKAK